MTVNVEELNAAIGLISTALPVVGTAYSVLKVIWMRTNPGKTEADFLNYLTTSSQTNIDDTSALLTAHGYVEQPDGSWKHVIPPLPPLGQIAPPAGT